MVKVSKFLTKLNDPSPGVKIEALREIGKIRDPDTLTQIFKLAEDEDDGVRTETAICLGKFADVRSGDILLKLSTDDDIAVRMEAAESLGIIGPRGFKDSKPRLEEMLSDENYRVRKYVMKALGRCGDPTTIDLLLAIFDKRETDLEVKEIIAETIGKIGGGYAMSILKGWIEEGTMEVRREAIKALGSMGNDAAIDTLISITKDKREDKIIKNHAKQALKNILNELKTNYMQLKKKIEKAI